MSKNDPKIEAAEKEFSQFIELHAAPLEERVRLALFDYFISNPTDHVELELYLMQCIASFLNTYTECVLKFEDIPDNLIKEAKAYGKNVALKQFESERTDSENIEKLITMPSGDA
jgi:hypothetical protein